MHLYTRGREKSLVRLYNKTAVRRLLSVTLLVLLVIVTTLLPARQKVKLLQEENIFTTTSEIVSPAGVIDFHLSLFLQIY